MSQNPKPVNTHQALVVQQIERKKIEQRYHDHLVESLGGNILLSPRREENNCKWVLDFGCGLDALVSRSLYERRETYRIAAVDFRNVGFASDLTGFYFVNAPMRSLEVLAEDQKFFHDNLMDLIVSRLLVPGMTDFKAYISQAFTMLKPGAYLEIQELEFAWMSRGPYERDPTGLACAWQITKLMQSVGFVDITTTTHIMLPPWWLTPPPPTRITDPTGYLDLGVFLTPEDRAQQQRAIAKELSELGYSPHEVEEYEGACELANATKALPLKTGMGSLGDGWPGKSSGVVRERQCVWVFVGRKPGGK